MISRPIKFREVTNLGSYGIRYSKFIYYGKLLTLGILKGETSAVIEVLHAKEAVDQNAGFNEHPKEFPMDHEIYHQKLSELEIVFLD